MCSDTHTLEECLCNSHVESLTLSHCGFTAEQSNLRDLIYFLFPPLSTSTRLFSPPPYSLTRSSFRSPCSMIGIIIRQLGNSLSLTWDGVPYHSVSSSTLNSSYFIGTQHQISAHVSAGFLTDHDCSERGWATYLAVCHLLFSVFWRLMSPFSV